MTRFQDSAMGRNPLYVDVFIAVVIAAIVLVLEPGVAIAAILALILLIVCAATFLIARRRSRARGLTRAPARRRAPRR